MYQPNPSSLKKPCQLGELWGAELKIAELKLALNWQSLVHLRELLQAYLITWNNQLVVFEERATVAALTKAELIP